MKDRKFYTEISDDRWIKAPKLPPDRPPTRRETWAKWHAIFFDRKGHKAVAGCTDKCLNNHEGELEAFCREMWLWYYISAFNLMGWRKQPDWVEGDPVISQAVPQKPFFGGDPRANAEAVYALLKVTHNTRRAA